MEEKKSIYRMRTIPKALDELKKNDPNTCVTYALLKNLCDNGIIQCFKTGNRFILNFDSLIEYLSNMQER